MAKQNLNFKKVLTLDELVEYSGFSKNYIYKLTAARKIPHSKPTGQSLFFDKEKIDQWLLSNNIETAENLDRKAATHVSNNPLK